MSPYGLEIVEMPELRRVFIFNISNAMSYRTIYMDGRSHPKTVAPTYLGHSVGRWDGDTLVIDTVGFSENIWMNRDGLPHTVTAAPGRAPDAHELRDAELRGHD